MSKKTIGVLVTLCFVILLANVIGYLNRYSRKMSEIKYRKIKLQVWHAGINQYLIQNPIKPECLNLFRFCVDSENIPYTKISMGSEYEQATELLNDPNLFEKEVPYQLLKCNNDWYVMETKGGYYYRQRLMIDKNAHIYIIQDEN